MIRLFFLVLFISFSAITDSFNAKVIGVTDGDTIVVLTEEKEQLKIRLEGIDCPESAQDFGQKAKKATVNLCFQKNVKIEKSGVDKYGRILAWVYVDDICINTELIKQGMAWHYKKYNNDSKLAKMEEVAKEQKVGLWSAGNAVAPWEWRKIKK